MSEFMPDSGPGDRAKRLAIGAVPVVVLLIVLLRVVTIVGDYHEATTGLGDGASTEATGSVEATEISGGTEGSADEQTTEPGAEETEEPEGETTYVRVNIPGLNFRVEPKSDADVMRTLPEGTRLVLLGEQNGWYQVRDSDGVTGWVSSSSQYVELETE